MNGDRTISKFDRFKMILEGRIYPAIKSCVSNRYKILLGIFVYYGFILSSDIYKKYINNLPRVNFLISCVFSAFVLHNAINYLLNAIDQQKAEKEILKRLKSGTIIKGILIEIFFTVVTLTLIWGARKVLYDVWFSIDL